MRVEWAESAEQDLGDIFAYIACDVPVYAEQFVDRVIEVFSRYIVGWRALKHMQTDLILDALEQSLCLRGKPKGVIHHSDF